MHYTHYYNIIIFVQSPGSVVRRTRTHRSRCCIWNWRDLKMLLFWAICRFHEHQFNQLWVWYGLHEMCNRQKLILYLTRGKPYLVDAKVFFWCFKTFFKSPCVLSRLTYYEYFCRKIELVSLFFHPGPRWIWNREKYEKRSLIKTLHDCLHKRW